MNCCWDCLKKCNSDFELPDYSKKKKLCIELVQLVAILSGLALFVISCTVAAGHLNSIVAGGCIVGLSAPLVIVYLVKSCRPLAFKEKIYSIIAMIMIMAPLTLGVSTLCGKISAVVLGKATIAPIIIGNLLGGAANQLRVNLMDQMAPSFKDLKVL